MGEVDCLDTSWRRMADAAPGSVPGQSNNDQAKGLASNAQLCFGQEVGTAGRLVCCRQAGCKWLQESGATLNEGCLYGQTLPGFSDMTACLSHVQDHHLQNAERS